MSTLIKGILVPIKKSTGELVPNGAHVFEKITKNTREGKLYEVKRRWTLWFTTPHNLVEGTWVEVEGICEAVVATKLDEQGNRAVSTWTDKNGMELPNIEYVLYGPELKRVQEPKVEKPRDLDDEAKYAPF